MFHHHRHAALSIHGRWLLVFTFALGLGLAAHGGLAGPNGPASSSPASAPSGAAGTFDIQAANDVLVTERLLAQFYNLNAQKPYLVGTQPVSPSPGIVPPSVNPSGTGGTTPTGTTGVVLAGTLSGGAESPGVASSATGTAQLTLSDDQKSVSYVVQVSGLSGPDTAVRVRRGLPGQPGGILLYTLNPLVNGVSAGQFDIRPGDVEILLNSEFYVEITTDKYPAGEIRGQIVLPTPGSNPPVITPPVVVPPATGAGALQSLVNEIRTDHTAHVASMEQMLGTSAQPLQSFQNLDAPTLAQFLIMAVTLEDFAVGVDQNTVLTPAPSAATTTPGVAPAQTLGGVFATEVAILTDNGRHAGGLRAYRRIVSTALGGDPNTTLTEHGSAFNTPHARGELAAFLQPYLASTAPGATTPPPTGGGTPPVGGTGGTGY